uniref:F-box domain-containing protein n=1 Tax=Mycena chlorophos TaxID=658473 RepID=A0ABQ0LK94_MYCCL|nr:predicted protein [Mycena chlorophos]
MLTTRALVDVRNGRMDAQRYDPSKRASGGRKIMTLQTGSSADLLALSMSDAPSSSDSDREQDNANVEREGSPAVSEELEEEEGVNEKSTGTVEATEPVEEPIVSFACSEESSAVQSGEVLVNISVNLFHFNHHQPLNQHMDTLPQEVIARIVYELDDREASLRACALVSSQFTEPCQRRLFSKLHMQPQEVALYLHYISYTTAVNHFHNFPHLAGYVKHLELNLLDFSKEMPMQALTPILNHLGNICDVTLKQGGFYFLSHVEAYSEFHRVLDMIWSCEPQIWNALCFRTLPNVPWEIIREGLWRTSTLRLEFLELAPYQDSSASPAGASRVSRPRLRVLDINQARGVYKLIRREPRGCFEQLSVLHVTEHAPDMPEALSILSLCASTLEELEITYVELALETNLQDALPPQLPRLRNLKVKLRRNPFQYISPFWIAPDVLCNLIGESTMPSLRAVTIYVENTISQPCSPGYKLPSSIRRLDQVLVRRLESGAHVEVQLVVTPYYQLGTEEEEERQLRAHVNAFDAELRDGLRDAVNMGLQLNSRGSEYY